MIPNYVVIILHPIGVPFFFQIIIGQLHNMHLNNHVIKVHNAREMLSFGHTILVSPFTKSKQRSRKHNLLRR